MPLFKVLIVEFCLFQFSLHENANETTEASILIEYSNSDWKVRK